MDAEIFQAIIMDHYRHPRHRAAECDHSHWSCMKNPACGDIVRIAIEASTEDGRIQCGQRSEGCAVSVASSSILCTAIQDMPIDQALPWIRRVMALIEGSAPSPDVEDFPIEIQSLLPFSRFPARQVCAALSWRCAENALEALLIKK